MIEQASSHKRIAWVIHELKSFLAIVLYLWVVFGLYVLNESIIMGKEHINFASHGFALINAIVLGKVLLVAEDMNFADRFKRGPLVFPIVYKALAFSILFVVFHIGESMLVGLFHGRRAVESFPTIGGGTPEGFLCVIAIMFVSLLPFFAFREIGRVIAERTGFGRYSSSAAPSRPSFGRRRADDRVSRCRAQRAEQKQVSTLRTLC